MPAPTSLQQAEATVLRELQTFAPRTPGALPLIEAINEYMNAVEREFDLIDVELEKLRKDNQ